MWKITILLCCLLGLSLSGAELLTEGGRSRYEIVLPADAVPAEQTAARELQSFLKQISGVERLPVRSGDFHRPISGNRLGARDSGLEAAEAGRDPAEERRRQSVSGRGSAARYALRCLRTAGEGVRSPLLDG